MAISIGGGEHSYRVGGYNHYTINELTRPFQATANLTGMDLLPHFVLHGAVSVNENKSERSVVEYVAHIENEELSSYKQIRKKWAGN